MPLEDSDEILAEGSRGSAHDLDHPAPFEQARDLQGAFDGEACCFAQRSAMGLGSIRTATKHSSSGLSVVWSSVQMPPPSVTMVRWKQLRRWSQARVEGKAQREPVDLILSGDRGCFDIGPQVTGDLDHAENAVVADDWDPRDTCASRSAGHRCPRRSRRVGLLTSRSLAAKGDDPGHRALRRDRPDEREIDSFIQVTTSQPPESVGRTKRAAFAPKRRALQARVAVIRSFSVSRLDALSTDPPRSPSFAAGTIAVSSATAVVVPSRSESSSVRHRASHSLPERPAHLAPDDGPDVACFEAGQRLDRLATALDDLLSRRSPGNARSARRTPRDSGSERTKPNQGARRNSSGRGSSGPQTLQTAQPLFRAADHVVDEDGRRQRSACDAGPGSASCPGAGKTCRSRRRCGWRR